MPEAWSAGTLIQSGLLANRPTAGVADRYYWATDIYTMFRDTGVAWEVVGKASYSRYIKTLWGQYNSFQTLPANLIQYSPIEIPYTLTIDRIGVVHGGTAGGNFYVAIYDSLNEAPVNRLAVSASTPCNAANTKQQVAIVPATLRLIPGLYYLALEADNAGDDYEAYSDQYRRPADINNGPSWYEQNLGGYVVPPAIAIPAFVSNYAKIFFQWVRVLGIP
jgi:hypothetical protein